jgi:hypothetical protein
VLGLPGHEAQDDLAKRAYVDTGETGGVSCVKGEVLLKKREWPRIGKGGERGEREGRERVAV